jgi:glycosyltransferase involved in cell wall biosynthesis
VSRLIVHVLNSFAAGGAERFVTDLVCSLNKQTSDHIEVWTYRCSQGIVGKELEQQARSAGVVVRCMGSTRRAVSIFAPVAFLWWWWRHRPDVINTHLDTTEFVFSILAMVGCRKTLMVRTLHSTVANNWKLKGEPTLLKGCWDVTVMISSKVGEIRGGQGRIGGKVSIVECGIDLRHLTSKRGLLTQSKAALLRELRLPPDCILVLSVGAIRRSPYGLIKGQDLVLRALRLIPDTPPETKIAVVFAGEGPDRKALAAEAEKIPCVAVRFLGERNDIPALMSVADVLLSASRFEGRPLVCLEAISHGLPLILSDIAEHEEFRRLTTAKTFQLENIETLASAIRTVKRLEDQQRASNVEANQWIIDSYSIDRTAQRYYDLYRGQDSTREGGGCASADIGR